VNYSEQQVSKRVADLLELPEGFELGEDWDLICADSDRLFDFLDVYENTNLTDHERRVLMELIIASFDEWLNTNESDAVERQIAHYLRENVMLHIWAIKYWGSVNSSWGEGWNVTPFIKQVWAQFEEARDQNSPKA
jgi:hypothetical protein